MLAREKATPRSPEQETATAAAERATALQADAARVDGPHDALVLDVAGHLATANTINSNGR